MADAHTKTTADMPPLTLAQRWLLGVVAAAGLTIAVIGFAGSYAAVSRLAEQKHFGWFAHAFPIGIDAGIAAFLALDLVLTWIRIPYPLLRHGAWTMTGATIAFNAAAAWGDYLAVGMHAAIPILFVVIVEAARHAVGRIANITANKHIESPPPIRWILSPISTFRIWRRMRLWHLTSYLDVIAREREAKIYRARLRGLHGRGWRRTATVDELLPLKLARYGTPISESLKAPQSDAIGAPSIAPAGRPESAIEAPQQSIQGATQGAPVSLVKRPQGAPDAAMESATSRHQGAPSVATEAPATAPPKRPAPATAATPKAPRSAATKRPKGDLRGAARDAIEALYETHQRRPLESEMVAALKAAKLPHSRQFANARRLELEKADPGLAALGSANVRPLTGS